MRAVLPVDVGLSGPRSVVTPLGEVVVEVRDCPACGAVNGAAAANRYSRGPWKIKDCAGCGFTYLDPVPRYEALSEILSWDVSLKAGRGQRAADVPWAAAAARLLRLARAPLPRRQVAALVRRHVAPGNVLDLGCSDGLHQTGLPPGYIPYGVEVSSGLAAAADSAFRVRGGRCLHSNARDGLRTFPDGFFAGAVMRSYLEHERDPRGVLRELARTLGAGAAVVVKVPNYASLNRRVAGRHWCGFRYPDHVNYFTPATLRVMAASEGYRVERLPWGELATSDSIWVLLRP